MVSSSASPLPCTREHERGTWPLLEELADIGDLVRGRVQLMQECQGMWKGGNCDDGTKIALIERIIWLINASSQPSPLDAPLTSPPSSPRQVSCRWQNRQAPLPRTLPPEQG